MIRFLYNVITPETSAEYNLALDFWKNHPDWKYFVRTNVRYSRNSQIWLGGGGATLEAALADATESVRLDAGKQVLFSSEGINLSVNMSGYPPAEGTETKVVIKNQ